MTQQGPAYEWAVKDHQSFEEASNIKAENQNKQTGGGEELRETRNAENRKKLKTL